MLSCWLMLVQIYGQAWPPAIHQVHPSGSTLRLTASHLDNVTRHRGQQTLLDRPAFHNRHDYKSATARIVCFCRGPLIVDRRPSLPPSSHPLPPQRAASGSSQTVSTSSKRHPDPHPLAARPCCRIRPALPQTTGLQRETPYFWGSRNLAGYPTWPYSRWPESDEARYDSRTSPARRLIGSRPASRPPPTNRWYILPT